MLRSLWNESCLILSSEPLILGRNPLTKITSLKCSREQVQIQLKQGGDAIITQLSSKCSFINKNPLNPGDSVSLKNGDVIKLTSNYSYRYESINKPIEKDVSMKTEKWRSCGSDKSLLVYEASDEHDKTSPLKIAGFDLDGTLIKTKSGKRFAIDDSDWTSLFDKEKMKSKLGDLRKNGYKIVMFTNQKGVGMGKMTVDSFKSKIERIVEFFEIPISCYIALKDGFYRKPMTGMWDEMVNSFGNASVNLADSFYVGDAAGRVEVKNVRKKDHSCSDRLFASNLGIKFLTPEQFFLGSKKLEPFEMPAFDPKLFVDSQNAPLEPKNAALTSAEQEMIILVGYPASGKSNFVEKHFSGLNNYRVISQDTLKSAQKCLRETENSLSAGKSVIVDNTNPDADSRSRYLNLARAKYPKCKLRCFVMAAGLEQARHNNKFRQLVGELDKQHKNVDDIVLYSFRKKFQEPTEGEGFSEIVRVNFAPNFSNAEHKRLYSLYLTDK